MLFLLAAVVLLSCGVLEFSLFAISLYVVGGAMYFFSITLLINAQFSQFDNRLSGNFINQILLNIGASFGILFFVYGLFRGEHIYIYSIAAIALSVAFFLGIWRFISDENDSTIKYIGLFFLALFLAILVYCCLGWGHLVRWVVSILFVTGVLGALSYGIYKRAWLYFNFVILILVFSLPYWIANTIFYNQFFFFLTQHVSGFHGIPATGVLLLDPMINILFGITYVKYVSSEFKCSDKSLYAGLGCLFLAFLVLALGLCFNSDSLKITALFPAITISLFACSQFLIQTQMNTKVSLFTKNKREMNFGLGMLRSVRAFGGVVAFLFIALTSPSSKNVAVSMHGNLRLYYFMAVLIAIVAMLYGAYKTLSGRILMRVS
jgi:hypothetical protein